jgi:carbamoyl-phosphate synthase large subunit
VVPRADDETYPDAIQAAVQAYGCDVVHAQPDQEVLALGGLRHKLTAATCLPEQVTLEVAADKFAFADRMRSAKVAVPEARRFASHSDVSHETAALLRSHERVWIRARVGAGARASLPVRTSEQAAAWVGWWCDERGLQPGDFMASEMLPGREFAYQSVWQDGTLIAGQCRERLEYLYGHLTPSGQTSTPAVARTVTMPAVDELAVSAIRALDGRPHGAFCVDVKQDASGTAKVTEINAGRFFTTSNFLAAAGLNMPDLLVRAALGERLASLGSSPLPPDLHWIRMVDMGYALVPGDQLDAWPRTGH